MDDLYDEFGNYIGEVDEDEDQSQTGALGGDAYLDEEEEEDLPSVTGQELMDIDDGVPSNAVILHEDKQYYPTAQQVYGQDVETLVQEEDTQALDQPIIAPVKEKKFTIQEADLPETLFSREFMTDLMNFPENIRNVMIAGHLHHGKTAFMDILVTQTHPIQEKLDNRKSKAADEQLRYTDVHILERERGVSIKAAPMSLVLPSLSGKSHLINLIDTPGHIGFADEIAASLRLVDGVAIVVDVVEGTQITTEETIKHAVLEDIPIVLIINKMDRLILELKMPPLDAYYKLKHVVEEVNTIIENAMPGHGERRRVSPEKGNVAFACSTMDWVFTLPSFAKMYTDSFGDVDYVEFARRLWGDINFNPETRKFTRRKRGAPGKQSFVHFVLEPIYKLYSHAISETPDDLKPLLESLGIRLKPSQLRGNPKNLLKEVCHQFFGGAEGFVDMVLKHLPSPAEGAQRMLDKYYTGPLDTKFGAAMQACNQDGPLVVHVTKLFNTADATEFRAFGRVMSGVARPGQDVRVLGEGYTPEDEEDMVKAQISGTWVAESRYSVPTSGVPAGNWVLLSGVDASINKTATVVEIVKDADEEVHVFRPVKHFYESVFKIAVEPLNPSELPKMLDGLRKVNKSYPLITTKVEESGEHIILGTGEFYMDCVLHDLRRLYAEMEIKVSDPVTRFCETCVETSAVKCYATTPNKKNTFTMLAEPLDEGIATDIETGKVSIKDPVRVVGRFFEDYYGYDMLASRNIWAFGPNDTGPNILQNDTLPSEVDAKTLRSVRESVRQGFNWATLEGPLCEEPIRNTKFRLTDVSLAQEAIARGGGQIIPTARRACYSSFLLASPRLMEPVYNVSAIGPADAVAAMYAALSRRRGHVLTDIPIPGTPLYRINGLVPVIDSFGFETDVRIATQGQTTVNLVFDRWTTVPGDPLDQSIEVRKLEAAPSGALARDFVIKTRRRKGLKEDLNSTRFLEADTIKTLQESGVLDR